MSEHLWSLATPSHADLEAVSRGGIPELTQQDVALAAAGLPRIEFLIALYSLAGDESVRSSVRTYLLEHLLAEREGMQWARKVETLDGQRVHFAEPLVEAVPGRGAAAEHLSGRTRPARRRPARRAGHLAAGRLSPVGVRGE